MTANEFRQMALALPGAIESAHMNHPSDGAAAITGQVIYVDSGYQIMGM